MERIAVFIDNSNLFQGFKKYNIKANYEKLKNLITRGRDLAGIYLYEGIIYPISPSKKKWYKDLNLNSGYIVKASFNKRTSNKAMEKKIDVKLAIDMVSLAYENMYDTAVLVSGDGDFVPVVKKLKKLHKKVELCAFRYSLANTLKEELDEGNIYYIDEYLSQITI
jgi:uncharacterized LabA/DUF88 family protein